MAITLLPSAPARTDAPATFVSKGDAFLAALVAMVPELNAAITTINANTSTAIASADTATTQAIIATAAAAAALSGANASIWVSGNTYAQGVTVISPANAFPYRKKTASSSSTTDPSQDSVNWLPVGGSPVGVVYANNNFGGF